MFWCIEVKQVLTAAGDVQGSNLVHLQGLAKANSVLNNDGQLLSLL